MTATVPLARQSDRRTRGASSPDSRHHISLGLGLRNTPVPGPRSGRQQPEPAPGSSLTSRGSGGGGGTAISGPDPLTAPRPRNPFFSRLGFKQSLVLIQKQPEAGLQGSEGGLRAALWGV
ncbi:unnamed protein product [Gadus morhua 'NCC']